jgi:hypothetical protein
VRASSKVNFLGSFVLLLYQVVVFYIIGRIWTKLRAMNYHCVVAQSEMTDARETDDT